MKPLHQALFALGLVLVATGTWWILTRTKPQAEWLRVEAPAGVARGETVTLRVTPLGLDRGQFLNLDLHGVTAWHHSLRVVGPGRPQIVGAPGETLEFRLTVSTRSDLAEAHAIIYVSPTGRWADRVRVAKSEPIPVEAGATSQRDLQPLHVHDHTPDPEIPRVELPGVRGLLILLWLGIASVLATRRQQTSEQGRPILLITACLAVALAEGCQLELILGNIARQFAQQHGLYDARLLPQQIGIVTTVVIGSALAALILFKARHRRLVLGLLAYGAMVTAAALSLHDVDAWFYTTLGGIPVEQLAKLAAVSLSLWGLRPRAPSA